MDIRFLGHACFELTEGDTRVLVDPFLSGNPKAAADAGELEPTHIFLTHGHFDHYGDIVDIAKRTGAQCVAIIEVANELGEQGVENVADPNIGGTVQFEGGWVRLTPAWHTGNDTERHGAHAGRSRDQPRREDDLPRGRHGAVLRHPARRRARPARRGDRLHRRALHDGHRRTPRSPASGSARRW